MAINSFDRPPIEDPLAELERQLLKAYVAGAGHDLKDLLKRSDDEARKLLADAARYAAERLSEVEARSSYIRHLHGQP